MDMVFVQTNLLTKTPETASFYVRFNLVSFYRLAMRRFGNVI